MRSIPLTACALATVACATALSARPASALEPPLASVARSTTETTPERQPPPPAPPPEQAVADTDAPATLLDPANDYAIGGFGGISVMYTRFSGENSVMVGGEGALIIDHAFTFGGGGFGIVTDTSAEQYTGVSSDRVRFGYGGAIMRYHFMSRSVVNIGVGALIGAGGVVIQERDPDRRNLDDDDPHAWREKTTEAVFVVEPQLGVYLNVTRWFRAGVMGSYRVVSGVETQKMDAGDLRGPSAGAQLQFGWF